MPDIDESTILPKATILEWFKELETHGYALRHHQRNDHHIYITAENDLCIFSVGAQWPGEYPTDTKGYLSCFASAKDGGSNDLHEGVQNRSTWDHIIKDILQFNQHVQDHPTRPLDSSPALSVYPIETQRRDCTVDADNRCPNNADFYMDLSHPQQEQTYKGFFCQAHWLQAISWAAQKGSAPHSLETLTTPLPTTPPGATQAIIPSPDRGETMQKTHVMMDFRSQLAHDLLPEGFIPTEHVTSDDIKYIGYTQPNGEELTYRHDPVCRDCRDCGCLRTYCMGVPTSGWDDLVPEEGCAHYDRAIEDPSCPAD